MCRFPFLVLLLSAAITCQAQQQFSRKDSLQGGLRFERSSFDVTHYALDITINPSDKSIAGSNTIRFKVVENTDIIQLDLFENMQVDSIIHEHTKLEYAREFNAVFVRFPRLLQKQQQHLLRFYYSGKPVIAQNAPWDGGFVFTKDPNGKPWVAVAVQGTGASLWYPCKDTQTDEPDNGATISVAVPTGLMNVSNGRLLGAVELQNGYTRWDWQVHNPINNYNITVNIGDYIHLSETYKGLDLDYYVLRQNAALAATHFEEVKPMMDCFQSKFGPYPFTDDGYKLVETPYLGMEHQSAVAYGNKYLKGYRGSDLSGTGYGLLFDFIIIHESGHEWFGNSISSSDIADMWIHEAFTCYSESVYLECVYGYETGQAYINGLRKNISNDRPMTGQYGVNNEGSGDMYYKGALLINTIRSIVNDDQKWWQMIYEYATTFRHKIIDAATVTSFFTDKSGYDLTAVFEQYLHHKAIPKLEMRKRRNKLEYRWKADVPGFRMPVAISTAKGTVLLHPTPQWQCSDIRIQSSNDISVQTDRYLIDVVRLDQK